MLTQYGWSAELQDQFKPYAAEGLAPGRIVVTQRGGYRLITEDGEVTDDKTAEFLRMYMTEFHGFIERVYTVLPRNT